MSDDEFESDSGKKEDEAQLKSVRNEPRFQCERRERQTAYKQLQQSKNIVEFKEEHHVVARFYHNK